MVRRNKKKMTKISNKTYVVEVTSSHRYGLNQDYYFRIGEKAIKKAAELKEWFRNCSDQTIKITNHLL